MNRLIVEEDRIRYLEINLSTYGKLTHEETVAFEITQSETEVLINGAGTAG